MKTFVEETKFTEQKKDKRDMSKFVGLEHPISPYDRGGHPIPPHLRGEYPIPPHERKNMMHIDFDESDYELFVEVFEDEDTAVAAMRIIHNAPPEVQILAVQLIKMIEEVA